MTRREQVASVNEAGPGRSIARQCLYTELLNGISDPSLMSICEVAHQVFEVEEAAQEPAIQHLKDLSSKPTGTSILLALLR
jgi:hypothetical protein